MTNAFQPAISSSLEGSVKVPRRALQALADWAHFPFCWDRISAKLPPQSPRWVHHTFADDVHFSLQQDRMAFLKDLFWKAEQEASRRERAKDPTQTLRGCPSLETFMECVAEMDDLHWDEPLTRKALAERRKVVRAKNAEERAARELIAKLEHEREHPTPESAATTMAQFGNISLFAIKENLVSSDSEIRAKAQEEVSRLTVELGKLMDGKAEA